MMMIQKEKVPAIKPSTYLKPIRNKRKIKAKVFENCDSQNLVKRHQNLHNNCFHLPDTASIAYKNSFFPRTISEWNELPESVVSAQSLEIFKAKLRSSEFE